MKPKKQCDDAEGCDRDAVKRGKCNAHYLRWRKATPPEERGTPQRPSDLERFFSFVNKLGPIAVNRPDLGRCMIWTGGTTRGYGIFWAGGTSHRAHVWIYKQMVKEPIPDGWTLDHFACDREECVNWLHCQPATHQVNILRSTGPAAINAAKTNCGTCGLPYDEANTMISGGRRYCLNCKRKREREAMRAKRAAAKAAAST